MKIIACSIVIALIISKLFIGHDAFGQVKRRYDQIIRNDKTAIEALISEVNETTIVYRRAAAPKGPIYRVPKTEINYVRYADGAVERFSVPPVARRQQPDPVRSAPEPQQTAPEPQREPAPQRAPAPQREPEPQQKPTPQRPEPISRSNGDIRTRFGLLLGAGAGWLSGGDYNSGMDLTLRGGVTAEIPISRRLAFSPSVEYLRVSWTTPQDVGFTLPAKLNYVVGTLAINTLYDDSKRISFYGSGGVYGAFGTGITLNVNGRNTGLSFDDFLLKAFHLGIESKLGARFSHSLTVYAQTNYGLTTMYNDASSGSASLKQVTFGLGARYLLGN